MVLCRRVTLLEISTFVACPFFVAIIALINPRTSWAAVVNDVDGKRVSLDLEEMRASPGDLVFAVDFKGKKKGIVQIKEIDGTRAKGIIRKGVVESGYEIIPGKMQDVNENVGRFKLGLLGGYSLDAMTVTNGTQSVSMSGNGNGVYLAADLGFGKNFSVRGLLGSESFQVAGRASTNLCDAGKDCKASVTYIPLGALARYSFMTGTNNFWAGGGVIAYLPGSKSSNAISSSSIGTSVALAPALGADLQLTPSFVMTFQLQYSMFLFSGSEVSASIAHLMTGFLVPF